MILKELKACARSLARSPGFTAVAVLTFALGIGANTAIFSVLDSVLLEPLPFREPDRLFALHPRYGDSAPGEMAVSPAEYQDLAARQRAFSRIAAVRSRAVNLTGDADAERVQAFEVTANLPEVLGAPLALGRGFTAEEARPGGPRAAILANGLWRRRFAADRSIVGRTIRIDGVATEVVGVLAPKVQFPAAGTFHFRSSAQLWLPVAWNEASRPRGDQFLSLVGRLAPGETADAARADLERVAASFRAEYPSRYALSRAYSLVAVPLAEETSGRARASILAVAGAVALLLLVACADVAGLLLARAATRRREIAIRVALGAGARRLLAHLTAESVLLALAGGAAGALLAAWGVDLIARLGPDDIPRLADASVGWRVLIFSTALSALAGVLAGVAPAGLAFAADVAADLKTAGADASGSGHRRGLREAIVVAQVAVTVVVAAGAGLLIASFSRLSRVDPGFQPGGVLALPVALPASRYGNADEASRFLERLEDRLSALPGVREAGAINPLPFSGDGWSGTYAVEGRELAPLEEQPHAAYAAVSAGYFRAMSVPLKTGRYFTAADRKDSPAVVVVDEALARREWPGESALGKRILIGGTRGQPAEVVGVVGHVRYAALEEPGEPQLYLALLQDRHRMATFAISTSTRPEAISPSVRSAVRDADPEIPTASIRTMDDLLAAATSRRRFQLFLISLFAGVSLLLAAVGLAGVLGRMVAARTREIGIRRALGARGADVLALVAGRGLALAGAGVLVGAAGALAATRLLASLLFEVSPTDPIVLGAVALVVIAAASFAAVPPAWRAVRLDPLAALRRE